MTCESAHRTRILFVALVAVLVALSIPATGHAAERDRLASAGVLERGSGYGSAGGSHAVRILQARLGRSGDRPGPIDGLYGPLTQGAVQRFQQRHGLAVDGIVGRQTRRALFAGINRPTASPDERDTKPGTLTRKSPSPSIGLESAGEQPHARPVPADAASRAGPVSGTSGVPPELIAALGALAGLMLFLTLRKQGEVRLNFGLTCAVLLAVFGVGAVAGALSPPGPRLRPPTARLRSRASCSRAPRRGSAHGAPPRSATPAPSRSRSPQPSAGAPGALALGERPGPSGDPLLHGARVRIARTRGLTGRSHRSGGPRRTARATDGDAASRGHLRREAGRLPVEHRAQRAVRRVGLARRRRSRSSPSSTRPADPLG